MIKDELEGIKRLRFAVECLNSRDEEINANKTALKLLNECIRFWDYGDCESCFLQGLKEGECEECKEEKLENENTI